MSKVKYIEERLVNLISLKDKYKLQTKAIEWKRKANAKEISTPLKDDFRTQISLTVKLQKDAELLANIPEFSFIPLTEQARQNRRIIKHIWNYHWLISNTDKAISNTVQSSTTYGTGILYEGIKHIFKKIKTPYYREVNGEILIDFKEEEKLVYSGIYTENIPFQNFFCNGTDIENSTEAIVVRYFNKTNYINEKKNDSTYKNISKLKSTSAKLHSINGTVGDNYDETNLDDTIFEIEYWNSAEDEYIILANGVEIKNTPIPYKHKQLPFSLYIDNKAEDRIWGIGEFELLQHEELYKNELRTLLVNGVKSSIGLIFKDKSAEIEEDELEFGIGQVYETDDINGLKQFAPNVPIGAIAEAERKIDEDIIAKSGVDFKSQLLGPNETATKTASKSQSARKRINKNIKDNAYTFYRRLAELRMSNIQFLHSIKSIEIPVEGGNINGDGVFISETGGYGNLIANKKITSGEFLVMPIVETMLGNNKQRRREELLQFAQIVGNLVEQDGTRPVKATQLAKLITDEFNYDFDKLTEQAKTSKSAEKILEEFKKTSSGVKNTPLDQNYIPPEQRNIQQAVPILSGINKPTLE